jgi:ubiquinone biosynthesis protein
VETVPVSQLGRFRPAYIAFNLMRFAGWVLLYRVTGRFDVDRNTPKLRRFLESMGGLWVKVGQLVAMRRDMFSDRFCDLLSALQDASRGFDPEVSMRIIEEELGCSIPEVFERFEPKPFAAASIGQLHEAWLRKEGVRVAVKVMRPNVADVFRRDLRIIRFCVTLLDTLGIARFFRWADFMWELEGTLVDELDYRLEATSMRRMRKKLKRHRVYVPRPFRKYCSRHVLVQEFIQGVFMSDYLRMKHEDPAALKAWHEENEVDPVKVGERLYFSHMRQLFEDHLFHCDLHPGNILITKSGRIALIDFGSVGTFEATMLRKYRMLTVAIATSDYSRAADMFLLLVPSLPEGIDTQSIKEKIIRLMRKWEIRAATRDLPYVEKSHANITSEIARVFVEHRVILTWEFMRINRAGLTLDSSLMHLMPEANYQKLAQRYFRGADERNMQVMTDRRAQAMNFSQTLRAMSEIPGTLSDYMFFEGDWLRRRAKNFQQTTSKLAYLVQTAATAGATLMAISSLVLINVGVHAMGADPWTWLFGRRTGRAINHMLHRFQPEDLSLLFVAILALLYLMWMLWTLRSRFALSEADKATSR